VKGKDQRSKADPDADPDADAGKRYTPEQVIGFMFGFKP